MITHSSSKRTARAYPQIESTIYLGITAPIMKFVSRVSGCVGNVRVTKGETCYAVKSARRESRYYVVKWNTAMKCWECSCGQHCDQKHDHIRTVKTHAVNKVVKPQVETIEAKAQPVVQKRTENVVTAPVSVEANQSTPIDWKAVMKADRARQRKWQAEYREAAAKLREEVAG